MWIFYSVLCMLTLAAADILSRKAVAADQLAPVKLRILFLAGSFLLGIGMYILRLGESGLAPWILLWKHPIILAAVCSIALSEFLYLCSLHTIGLSVMEAISSLEGLLIFAGLAGINFFSGRLRAVKEMFVPVRLLLVLLILLSAFLLPNMEILKKRKCPRPDKPSGKKTGSLTGIVLAFLGVILGSIDSLISDTILDAGLIGVTDLAMTSYFSQILLLPFFGILLLRSGKGTKLFSGILSPSAIVYVLLNLAYIFFGILALSIDAVRSEILFQSYPVLAILGARIFLQEKYTGKQNLCIWIITLAAIAFCLTDYLL